jgi:transposase
MSQIDLPRRHHLDAITSERWTASDQNRWTPQIRYARTASLESAPGRQAQVDFAHFRTVFTDEPGTERILWLFSLVLGHSRMMWARFVLHQDLPSLLRCHAAAFEALGGVPEHILYDRMRTVFSREDPEAGHIVYNRTLLEFARHYGYLPKACKPYRAKTKGKVERFNSYLKSSFVVPVAATLGAAGLKLDVAMANVHVRRWLDEVANTRVHATTKAVPALRLAEERAVMLPAPALKTAPMIPQRVALPVESLQHPLSVYDELLEVLA